MNKYNHNHINYISITPSKMSNIDVMNMLLELAGSQVLKSDLKPIVNVVDENDILAEVELKIFEYYNSVENIGKLLHDKKQQIIIFNKLAEIIDKYNFSIRDSYKQLWEIYIFNALPISDPKLSVTINEKSIELINTIKSKILNNVIKTDIDNNIRTPSKIKSIIKRILNIQTKSEDFVSIFNVNVEALSSVETIIHKRMEENSENYKKYLDKFLDDLNLNDNSNELISNYYKNVKMLADSKLRNNYYNKILTKIVTQLNKLNSELKKNNDKILTSTKDYQLSKLNEDILALGIEIIKIKNIFVQFYLYLINYEKVKTLDKLIVDYLDSTPINWFSYQIDNLATNLLPHWNFKDDKFKLEPKQNEALHNIDLKKNILLSAPTSWGKTLLSTYATFNNSNVIYIVPTKPTAQQLAGMILSTQIDREKLAGSVRKNIRIEIQSLSAKRFSSEDNIIIATPQELYNMIKMSDIPQKIDYVILDEFHKISYENGQYYEYILSYAGFNKIPTMCLSATIPNFEEVADMLSKILYGEIHCINEHRRFYNIKRYGIFNKEMKLLNPLEWLTKDSIRSPETHFIGLEPKVAVDFYKKIPNVTPIDDKIQKFASLDDIHKMECDGFTKLKGLSDEDLDGIISNNSVELDVLTDYELYLVLKKCNMSMKPMLVFNFNSRKCMDRFNKQIALMKDRSRLIYGNYNSDQEIIKKYFEQMELFEEQTKEKESKSKKDSKKDGSNKDSTSNEEEYASREDKIDKHKEVLYEVIIEELKEFYDEYLETPIEEVAINTFNKMYGAKLTTDSIMKLRRVFVQEQLDKYSSANRLSLRNKYAIHQECRLTMVEIDPENMRKIKRKINRELLREKNINGDTSTVELSQSSNTPKAHINENHATDAEYINEVSMVVPEELDAINYDHPCMLGLEYGLLLFCELMNPGLLRVFQQVISQYPFITFADRILAEGINYPIKAVMLLGGMNGEKLEKIDNTLAHQAMGRAGRRGLDMVGVVIFCGVIVDDILVQRYKRITRNSPSLMDELMDGDSEDFIKFVRMGERPVPKVVIKSVEVVKTPTVTIEVKVEPKAGEVDFSEMTWEEYCELNP